MPGDSTTTAMANWLPASGPAPCSLLPARLDHTLYPLLCIPRALAAAVSAAAADSRRLSNWPQNLPGNRARSSGRSDRNTIHSEKLSLPVNDRQTGRGREGERDRECERKGTVERHFHFDFNFVFQSRYDTIRSINVKLESVHWPQTIALFAKKFPFPFLSFLYRPFPFSWSPAKVCAHTFISLPFLSLYLSNPIPMTSDNIIRDRSETRDRWGCQSID